MSVLLPLLFVLLGCGSQVLGQCDVCDTSVELDPVPGEDCPSACSECVDVCD